MQDFLLLYTSKSELKRSLRAFTYMYFFLGVARKYRLYNLSSLAGGIHMVWEISRYQNKFESCYQNLYRFDYAFKDLQEMRH